jgi:hypothetical protein
MRSTLVFVSLTALSLPVLASHDGSAFSRRHASGLSKRIELEKRQTFGNARFSFYDVTAGQTACGGFYSNNDPVVALNAQQFDGGSHCGDSITITYKGTTRQATIVDECMGCGYGGLDLTENFFSQFASQDAGIIYGSWVGLGGDAPPPPPPPPPKPTSTPPPPPPPPTSTQKKTSSTPAYTPPPPPPPPTTSTSVYTPPPTTSTTSTTPKTTATPTSSAVPTTKSSAAPTSSAPAVPTAGLAKEQALGLVGNAQVVDLTGTQNLVSLYQAAAGLGYIVLI